MRYPIEPVPAPSSGFVDEQGGCHSSPDAAMSDPYADKADDCNWGTLICIDHERAVLDVDTLVKRLCDLAWENGWVLEYKLARREADK